MTRRALLVPLFAAALILAPAEISGKIAVSPLTDGAFEMAAATPGSSAEAGRTGFYRWSVPLHREALSP